MVVRMDWVHPRGNIRAGVRASWDHAADWAHGRVAFTLSRTKTSPAQRALGFHPRCAPSSPMGLSSALRAVTLRRLRHARLPSVSGLKQGRFASLRFLALAPVHPRCSARLRASSYMPPMSGAAGAAGAGGFAAKPQPHRKSPRHKAAGFAINWLVTLRIGRTAGSITPTTTPPNRRRERLPGLPASALSLSFLRAYPRAS